MWIIELTMKTITDDSKIGSQSKCRAVMKVLLEVICEYFVDALRHYG